MSLRIRYRPARKSDGLPPLLYPVFKSQMSTGRITSTLVSFRTHYLASQQVSRIMRFVLQKWIGGKSLGAAGAALFWRGF